MHECFISCSFRAWNSKKNIRFSGAVCKREKCLDETVTRTCSCGEDKVPYGKYLVNFKLTRARSARHQPMLTGFAKGYLEQAFPV